MRSPCTIARVASPCSPQLEKVHVQQWRFLTAIKRSFLKRKAPSTALGIQQTSFPLPLPPPPHPMSASSTSHVTVCDVSPPGCSQSLFNLRLSPLTLTSVRCQSCVPSWKVPEMTLLGVSGLFHAMGQKRGIFISFVSSTGDSDVPASY